MTQDQMPETKESLAQHKERLLLQCSIYRAGIGRSRKIVRAHLNTDDIAKTAVAMISARAQLALANFSDSFDLKNISGAKLQRLLPLLISGVSLLSRRSLLMPMLRGASIAGIGVAAIYFLARKKTAKADGEHVALHEHL